MHPQTIMVVTIQIKHPGFEAVRKSVAYIGVNVQRLAFGDICSLP